MPERANRYMASPIQPFPCDHCGSLVSAIVVDMKLGTVVEVCLVRSLTAAKRIANALNIYRPKKRKRRT